MTLTFIYELPKVLLLLEKTSDSRRSWSCVLLCDIVVWALGIFGVCEWRERELLATYQRNELAFCSDYHLYTPDYSRRETRNPALALG